MHVIINTLSDVSTAGRQSRPESVRLSRAKFSWGKSEAALVRLEFSLPPSHQTCYHHYIPKFTPTGYPSTLTSESLASGLFYHQTKHIQRGDVQ